MPLYAKVLNGAVLEYANMGSVSDQTNLAAHKPRWLPVVVENENYDPRSQVREGPAIVVEAARVVKRYTVRAKDSSEIAAAKRDKIAQLQDETFRRAELVMTEQEQRLYACLGVDFVRTHGAYATWPAAAKNAFDPLHTLWLLARSVFQTGKQKQAEINAITSAAQIADYDVAAGW